MEILLRNGADVSIKTFKGELPYELTTSTEVLAAMKMEPDESFTKRCSEGTSHLPIVPGYLKTPAFLYGTSDSDDLDGVTLPTPSASNNDVHTTGNVTKLPSERAEVGVAHNPVASKLETIGDGTYLTTEASVSTCTITSPLIVRVRVSGDKDNSDFVEVEVPSSNYSSLLASCCEELELAPGDVAKIRKLPNIWIRKDKEVQRLTDGQELELVLKN